MRLSSGSLLVATCLTFGGAHLVAATPADHSAIKQVAATNSATLKAVYTYRRTKHGFEQSLRNAKLAERLLKET
jgi:hypothetical protein